MSLTSNVFLYGISPPTKTDPKEDVCPGCNGKGYQERKDNGLRVVCPICKGSGKWIKTWSWNYWISNSTCGCNDGS